jgi:hypothetical protein
MKLVAPRLVTHYFTNAGNPAEGNLRAQAELFVKQQKTQNPRRAEVVTAAFQEVIKSGRANAVATPESESPRVLAALRSIDPGWHRVLEAGGLVLMLPSNAGLESRVRR